jgi:hypothetical protein
MKNLHKAVSIFNISFFSAAALAAFYIVYESWHFGFFLTPFPLLLTVIALMLGGAALAAVHVMRKGPAALYEPSVTLPKWGEKFIRFGALLLPLPLMSYALMSYSVQHWQPGTQAMFAVSLVYVDCERVLFGVKRADDRLSKLAEICCQRGNHALAEKYAEVAVSNIAQVPTIIFGSADSYKKRLVERLDQLANIYEQHGKHAAALQTWQRKHVAIHALRWESKTMRHHCSTTIAHQAYNHARLGDSLKAETLYRLAERVMPIDDSSMKKMPLFVNHARILLSHLPSDSAATQFSPEINRYNPKLSDQQLTAANAVIAVSAEEYERLTNGVVTLPMCETP